MSLTPTTWQLTGDALGRALIDAVMGSEGVYSNNPDDRGGETIWGITVATARKCGFTGPMIYMQRQDAAEIYMKLFWRNRFDQLASIGMQHLAYECLDFGVNSGAGRPAEALQRALNSLNLMGKRWADLTVDGGIGPKTIATLATARSQMSDVEQLVGFVVNSIRVTFVLSLAERSPSQETFMLGWLRRFLRVSETSHA